MRRLLPTLAVVSVVAVAAGCSDDGYAAPEREVSVGELLEDDGSPRGTVFDEQRYVAAWADIAEATGRDPSDPSSFLDGGRPDRYAASLVVACAWGSAMASTGDAGAAASPLGDVEGVEGFAGLRDRLVEATGGGDCGSLDEHALARIQRDLYVPPTDTATWLLVAEIDGFRATIAAALSPEIAEAVAG